MAKNEAESKVLEQVRGVEKEQGSFAKAGQRTASALRALFGEESGCGGEQGAGGGRRGDR